MNFVDWSDREGIKRRMAIPDGVTDPAEGIPISLDVDSLYQQATVSFRRTVIEELWIRGLVVPEDFLKPGAPDLIRAALLATYRRDALDIMSLAKERLNNARR